MIQKQDTPGVAIKPPILYLISILTGLLLSWVLPVPLAAGAVGTAVGILLIILGTGLAIWGSQEFNKHDTHVNPDYPATHLVTSGPFRYSRNPMYLALTLAQIGIGLALNILWPLLTLIPTLIIMNRFVIAREEKYLKGKFGQAYIDYKAAVRRWL